MHIAEYPLADCIPFPSGDQSTLSAHAMPAGPLRTRRQDPEPDGASALGLRTGLQAEEALRSTAVRLGVLETAGRQCEGLQGNPIHRVGGFLKNPVTHSLARDIEADCFVFQGKCLELRQR